jgi:hypothetical protein
VPTGSIPTINQVVTLLATKKCGIISAKCAWLCVDEAGNA